MNESSRETVGSGKAWKKGQDLTYFVTFFHKRFPRLERGEIEKAVESAQLAIAPSTDRTKLKRKMLQLLSGH